MRTCVFAFSLLALAKGAFAQEAVTAPEATSPEITSPTPTNKQPTPLSSSALLYSANGPGEGEARWGMGGRVVGLLPMFDVGFVYGATERLSVEMRASAVGVPLGLFAMGIGFLEPGVRYKLTESGDFSLALHGSAMLATFAAINPDDTGSVFSFRVQPGLLASLEKTRRTFSFGLDAPLSFAEGGVGVTDNGPVAEFQNTGFSTGLNSSFTMERPLASQKALYTQLQVQTLLAGTVSPVILPFFSLGVSW